jgi:phosphoribosyl 1,2-cyclic phosphodiesterase
MDDPSRMLTDRIAAFRVLASGSGGNCSVLVVRGLNGPRVILIDAGLSPRRTRRALEHMGLTFDAIDSVLITHLDHDHWKPNWATALPGHSTIHLHRSHARRGRYQGLSSESARLRVFDHPLELMPGVRADPFSVPHDEQGAISYRLSLQDGELAASLGFATDLGHAGDGLISHLRSVDVLAIESNYCPDMQEASTRPLALKRRIMGGAGHLSNQQCVRAVEAIAPLEHVVLLHLSRECNDPSLAASFHAGSDYSLTVSSQHAPTRWIRLGRVAATPSPGLHIQMPLFGASHAAAM